MFAESRKSFCAYRNAVALHIVKYFYKRLFYICVKTSAVGIFKRFTVFNKQSAYAECAEVAVEHMVFAQLFQRFSARFSAEIDDERKVVEAAFKRHVPFFKFVHCRLAVKQIYRAFPVGKNMRKGALEVVVRHIFAEQVVAAQCLVFARAKIYMQATAVKVGAKLLLPRNRPFKV